MPIKLTIVGGPLDGKVFEYAVAKSSITIGRYPDCDIVFPSDMIAVSRAHLTVVHENARYLLRPEQPVFIDGQEAVRDDPLPMQGEMALGKRDGPRIRFEWSAPHDMPKTEDRPRAQARNPLREAERALKVAQGASRRFVLLALGVAVLAAGAIAAFLLTRENPIEARLAPLRPSVYLVVVRTADGFESGAGTAWVIAPGVLATNAHVAVGVAQRPPGAKALVRSSVPPYHGLELEDIKVADIHPHYAAFTSAVRDYGPASNGAIVEMLGYDVALLRVRAADAAKLGPPLRIADAATLERLAPQRVAYIGFPQESLFGRGTVPRAPSPQIKFGEISAVTDYFLLESEPARRQLIQHSLPIHGGSSGSPMFNAAGEVIGLVNAMNIIGTTGGRAPSAALINFGQRADLATELLAGTAARLTAERQRQWQASMATFERGEEHFPKWFFAAVRASMSAPLFERRVKLSAVTMVGLAEPKDVEPAQVRLPGKGTVMFIAHHLGSPGIEIEVFLLGSEGKRSSLRKVQSVYRFTYWATTVEGAADLMIAVRARKPGEAQLRVFFVPRKG